MTRYVADSTARTKTAKPAIRHFRKEAQTSPTSPARMGSTGAPPIVEPTAEASFKAGDRSATSDSTTLSSGPASPACSSTSVTRSPSATESAASAAKPISRAVKNTAAGCLPRRRSASLSAGPPGLARRTGTAKWSPLSSRLRDSVRDVPAMAMDASSPRSGGYRLPDGPLSPLSTRARPRPTHRRRRHRVRRGRRSAGSYQGPRRPGAAPDTEAGERLEQKEEDAAGPLRAGGACVPATSDPRHRARGCRTWRGRG